MSLIELDSLRFNLIKKADAVIALTHIEKDWLSKAGIDIKKIHVIGGGPVVSPNYNAGSFKKKYRIAGNIVLFVATKRKNKGYLGILESMKCIWTKHPDTYFVFIGLQTSESLEVFGRYNDRRVIDIGLVDLEEKTSALAACTIFCMPSSSESFGIVFTEAWFMSKPVIGGEDCLSTKEIIDDGKNGFIVSQEPKAIAEKIILLLDNEELCKQMGEAGKQKVLDNYIWEKSVDRLRNIYSGL